METQRIYVTEEMIKNAIEVAKTNFKNDNKSLPVLNEGLICTYDPLKTKNIVLRAFGIAEKYVSIDRHVVDGINVDLLTVIIPKEFGNNDEGRLVNLMRQCGYHICNKGTDPRMITFEPKYTKNIGTEIKKKYKWLYHSTPVIYIEGILKNGLTPHGSESDDKKKQNPKFYFPDRTYVMRGNTLKPYQFNVFKDIQMARMSKDIKDTNQFLLLKIDVDKLPDDIDFYADPSIPKGGLFTYNTIPPYAITIEGLLSDENTEKGTPKILKITEDELKSIIKDSIDEIIRYKPK